MRREQLEFLADNTHFTKRFAFFVGRRCRHATIKDVAKELNLDWDVVKELDKQYMAMQLARAGTPGPKVIGTSARAISQSRSESGTYDAGKRPALAVFAALNYRTRKSWVPEFCAGK